MIVAVDGSSLHTGADTQLWKLRLPLASLKQFRKPRDIRLIEGRQIIQQSNAAFVE